MRRLERRGFILLIIACAVCAVASACSFYSVAPQAAGTSAVTPAVITALPTASVAPSPTARLYWMPDFPIADVSGNSYVASPKELADYVNLLVGEGFIMEKNGYDDYLERGSLFIQITDNTANCNECTVIGGTAIPSDGDEFAVCDIDHDGKPELLYLSFGPTSGIFSFYINAVGFDNGDVAEKYGGLFMPHQYCDCSFTRTSDSQVNLTVTYLNGESLTYLLAIQDGRIILTSCP